MCRSTAACAPALDQRIRRGRWSNSRPHADQRSRGWRASPFASRTHTSYEKRLFLSAVVSYGHNCPNERIARPRVHDDPFTHVLVGAFCDLARVTTHRLHSWTLGCSSGPRYTPKIRQAHAKQDHRADRGAWISFAYPPSLRNDLSPGSCRTTVGQRQAEDSAAPGLTTSSCATAALPQFLRAASMSLMMQNCRRAASTLQ